MPTITIGGKRPRVGNFSFDMPLGLEFDLLDAGADAPSAVQVSKLKFEVKGLSSNPAVQVGVVVDVPVPEQEEPLRFLVQGSATAQSGAITLSGHHINGPWVAPFRQLFMSEKFAAL